MIWKHRISIVGVSLVFLLLMVSPCGNHSNHSNSALKNENTGTKLEIRGVIEGFYGTPWSNEERMNMFKFMQKENLNTYVYAPKDDPYQRVDWRTPYPAARLKQMKLLVQAAKQDHVRFVYSLSPGMTRDLTNFNKSITYSSQSDRKELELKIDQLQSIGIDTFMLSFDDIKPLLKPSDQKVYGLNYSEAQMKLANQIFSDEKVKNTAFQLWFTPTSYHGLKDNTYWKSLRSTLNRNIKVIWTGEGVFNKTITSEQAKTITKLLDRQPILWDNYPVNDYTYVQGKQHQLIMGPLQGRSATLTRNIAGYISNPMLQPQASKLALQTVADYLKNPTSYEPKMAWENAIKTMPGITNPALFKTFVAVNTASTINPNGYSPLKAMISAYQNASTSKQKQAAEKKLRTEFLVLNRLPVTLPKTITDKELLIEIQPWLTKLGSEGKGGLDALAYINQPNQTNKQRLDNQIRRVASSPYKIGEEDIMIFMKWAENRK